MRETEKDGERKVDIEREKETKNERVKYMILLRQCDYVDRHT